MKAEEEKRERGRERERMIVLSRTGFYCIQSTAF
jgi:hypothetical protein